MQDQLRFVLSEDVELKQIGPQTTHNWQDDFNDYLRILQTGLRDRLPATRQLFRDWDRLVFGQTQSQYGGLVGGAVDARQATMNAALDLMHTQQPEPESEDED